MFGRQISLFKIFGFQVKFDWSWLILGALVTWSLATGLFPQYYKALLQTAYWWMGAAGALGLFLSILFHELSHSIIARKYGIPIKGITLFIFGGVAEMEDDPPNSKTEFLMASAGPMSSAFLSLIMYLLHYFGTSNGWPVPVEGVLAYLAWINVVLAVFNLLPAFPLDGGRVLRSILWKWKKDLRWATSVSSRIGAGFGVALVVLGVLEIFRGDFVGGLWWFMIGIFMRSAALMSYQQLIARSVFHSQKVGNLMVKDPVTVPRQISLEEFVRDYVYKFHFKTFPVISSGRLYGCVSVNQAAVVPRNEWAQQTVGAIASPCNNEMTVQADDNADKALSIMTRTGNSRLFVVEGDKLKGIIALKDMLKLLTLKMELNDFENKQEGGRL